MILCAFNLQNYSFITYFKWLHQTYKCIRTIAVVGEVHGHDVEEASCDALPDGGLVSGIVCHYCVAAVYTESLQGRN